MIDVSLNNDAYYSIHWIIDHANRGFYLFTASPPMQQQVAKLYQQDNVAVFDYSAHSGAYSYYPLAEWIDQQESSIVFILNLQVALQEDRDISNFNLSRDMLSDQNKVYIFGMTPDLEIRLTQQAYDLFSYIRIKTHFIDENIPSPQYETVSPPSFIATEEVKNQLSAYRKIEETIQKQGIGETSQQQLSTASTLSNIAKAYLNVFDCEHALMLYNQVKDIKISIWGESNSSTATTYYNIAEVYFNRGDYNEALEWFQKALDIREEVLGKEHPDTAETYNNIALVYSRQGDYNRALEEYQKALNIQEKVLGKEHPNTATTYNNIAGVYDDKGDYAKALEGYQKALNIREKVLGKEHPDTAGTYNNIAFVYSYQGDYSKALKWYQKALDIQEKVLGKEHPYTATTYNNIAGVYDSQGDYTKALEWFQKALNILEKILGENHPSTLAVKGNTAYTQLKLKK
jgi:tetratricopeptide (TPR) repeat protein